MATPIGHALAGLAIASLASLEDHQLGNHELAEHKKDTRFWRLLHAKGPITLLCIFMAVAPDLDLIPGILLGQPVLYHGGISHSLGCGVMLSLLVTGLWRVGRQQFSRHRFDFSATYRRVFVMSLLAFSTHLLLDMLGPDGREPFGIPLLWPLSDGRFLSPVPLLPGVHHASTATAGMVEFIEGVFSLHNVMAILWECLFTVPFIVLGKWRNRHRDVQNPINVYS